MKCRYLSYWDPQSHLSPLYSSYHSWDSSFLFHFSSESVTMSSNLKHARSLPHLYSEQCKSIKVTFKWIYHQFHPQCYPFHLRYHCLTCQWLTSRPLKKCFYRCLAFFKWRTSHCFSSMHPTCLFCYLRFDLPKIHWKIYLLLFRL